MKLSQEERKYFNGLRWRIVYTSDEPATLDNRAQTYVAVSTVHHIYRLFEESGTVDPVHNTILMGYFVYVTRSRCEWYGRIHGNFEHSHSSTMV